MDVVAGEVDEVAGELVAGKADVVAGELVAGEVDVVAGELVAGEVAGEVVAGAGACGWFPGKSIL